MHQFRRVLHDRALMARAGTWEWSGRVKCSYKRATMVICTGNLVVALYVLHSLLSPLYIFSSSSRTDSLNDDLNSLQDARYSEDELERMHESMRVRRESEPVDLILRVKEIREESFREEVKQKRTQSAKRKVVQELLQRLKQLKASGNMNEQEALKQWRNKKLEEAKKQEAMKATSNSTVDAEDASMVARILESNWGHVLEEVGLVLSSESPSLYSNGKLLGNGPEIEDGIIPGRPLPAECHAEAHTDYNGAAVKWGLTHHKESAADCCQACLDHAKSAKEGEKKCNIWVYCASETGCYSPDIYEHKHQECWLKQDDHPKLNFKGKYNQAYRQQHPTAPIVVPWVSGVIGG